MEQYRRDCIDKYDELLADYHKFMKIPYMENIILHILNLFDVRTNSAQVQNTINTVILHLYVYGFLIVANGKILNSQTINLHFIRRGKLPQGYHFIKNLSQYAYSSQNGSKLPGNGDIFLFQNVAPCLSDSNVDIVDATATAPVRSCKVQLLLLAMFGRNVGIRDILNADYPDFSTIERKHLGETQADDIIEFNSELNDHATTLADNIVHPSIKNGGNDVLMYIKPAIYIIIGTLGFTPHVLGHLQPYEHIGASINEGTLTTKMKMLMIVRNVIERCKLDGSIFLSSSVLPNGIIGKTQNKRKSELKHIYGLDSSEYMLETYLNDTNTDKHVNEPQFIDDDDDVQKKKRKKRTED